MRNFYITIIFIFSIISCFAEGVGEMNLISVTADGSTTAVVLNEVKKLTFAKSRNDGTVFNAQGRNGGFLAKGTKKIYFRTETKVEIPADTIPEPIDTTTPPPVIVIPPVDTVVTPPADTTYIPEDTIPTIPPADTLPETPQDTIVQPVEPEPDPEYTVDDYDPDFNGSKKKKNSDIVIYPNPVSSVLNIQGISRKELVEIYDIQGKLILTENGTTVDVTSLTKGTYMLRVRNCNMLFIKK